MLPMGGFQSDSFEGRETLFIFELQDEKVKVWMGRGAGKDARQRVLGKTGYCGIFSLKEILFKRCGNVSVDAKVELLHSHLPGDVAHADSTLHIHASEQINET